MLSGSGSEHVSVATQAAGSRGRLLTILLRPLYADKIPDGKPANEFGYDERILDEVSLLQSLANSASYLLLLTIALCTPWMLSIVLQEFAEGIIIETNDMWKREFQSN